MELRDLVAALAVGCVGATVGAITAVGYPAVLAVGTATVAALSCCTLFDRREIAVEVGLVSYGALGVATLAAGIPPAYPGAIGAAILASVGVALPGLWIARRAGATIHAAKTGDGRTDRWRWSARRLSRVIDRWRGDRRDRLLLLAGPGVALAIHLVVVASGAPVALQALTLVPVAVSAFAVFAVDSSRPFVAPEPSGTPIHLGRFSGVTAAIADRADSVTDRVRSVRRRPATGTDRSTTSKAAEGGTTSQTPHPAVSTDRSRQDAGDDRGDQSLDPCQNCGSEAEDRSPRFVVSEHDLRVVLCADCQDARIETMRTLADCSGDAVRGAIAEETQCGACGEATELQAHPIVPLDAGGHRHPNNVLALCPSCHRAVDDHAVNADSSGSPEAATRDRSH